MTNDGAPLRPLRVGVVGAGRVGAVLGAALRRAGHEIVAVSGASPWSRDRIAALLPGVPRLGVHDVVERGEFVLLCLPDDALPALVAGLAAAGGWRAGQVVAHVSGSHGVGVLAPAERQGVVPLALHPAMTFSGTDLDLPRLADCCFGITAPDSALPLARALVASLGATPVVIREEDRTLYHAALAHSANHLVTLVAQSRQLLSSIGVRDPGRLLAPLLGAALDNALRRGDDALTGPVARGDAGTVTAHAEVLAERATGPDVLATYRALARATTERALAAGRLDAEPAARLLGLLEEPDARR